MSTKLILTVLTVFMTTPVVFGEAHTTYSLKCNNVIESNKRAKCTVTRSQATDDAVTLNYELTRIGPLVQNPALNPHGDKPIIFPNGKKRLKIIFPLNPDDKIQEDDEIYEVQILRLSSGKINKGSDLLKVRDNDRVKESTTPTLPPSTTTRVAPSSTTTLPPSTTTRVAPSTTTRLPPSTTTRVDPSSTTRLPPLTTTRVAPSSTKRLPPSTTTRVAPSTTTRLHPSTTIRVAPSTTTRLPPSTTTRVAPSTTTRLPPLTTTRVFPSTSSGVTASTTTSATVSQTESTGAEETSSTTSSATVTTTKSSTVSTTTCTPQVTTQPPVTSTPGPCDVNGSKEYCDGITYELKCTSVAETENEATCIITRNRATDDAVRLNYKLTRRAPTVASPALNPHGEKQIFFPKGETQLTLTFPLNPDDMIAEMVELYEVFILKLTCGKIVINKNSDDIKVLDNDGP